MKKKYKEYKTNTIKKQTEKGKKDERNTFQETQTRRAKIRKFYEIPKDTYYIHEKVYRGNGNKRKGSIAKQKMVQREIRTTSKRTTKAADDNNTKPIWGFQKT